MQGLQPSVIIASALLWASVSAHAQSVDPDTTPYAPVVSTAEQTYARIGLLGEMGMAFEPEQIHVPGAKFVKVHFSEFKLPAGVLVEVSNPDRSEIYRYSLNHYDPITVDASRGDDGIQSFSAMSVSGDTATVRVLGLPYQFDPEVHRIEIDSWMHRSADPEPLPKLSQIQFADDGGKDKTAFSCGAGERYDAVCWSETYPGEYDRSQPVALMITSDGMECTAWRVGSDNRLFTAQHCMRNQEDLDGAEIWFNYEATSCGGNSTASTVKVTGQELLATDKTLDYALFSVNDFSSITKFGNLGLDVRKGDVGENIFIPQHGLGKPRQISVESDMNVSGMCEIDDNDVTAYGVNTDIGYYCDTTNSSSGSPVVSAVTGKAIALHHLGGCLNMGTKVALICPQVKQHFNNQVPEGDGGGDWAPPNDVPQASWSSKCDGLNCTFDSKYSFDKDGEIIAYAWDFGDGESASGNKASHSYASDGEFTVSLTVQDDEGATDTHTGKVTVSKPNSAPKAQFSVACIDAECTFNGSASSDSDGQVKSWSWDLGDGSASSGSKVAHEYGEDGHYEITLTVTDDKGAANQTVHAVDVTRPNIEPEAAFEVNCDQGRCLFDASASSDSDGHIAKYYWTIGGKSRAYGERVSHSFTEDGSYEVQLTVTDDRGKHAWAEQVVEIDLPNRLPAAVFTVSCKELTCTMDARSSYDLDGEIESMQWSLGDGSEKSEDRFTHTYDKAGEFAVTLTVSDNEGGSHTTTKTVKVEDQRKIKLNAVATTRNKKALAYLKWKGAKSHSVQILRNGKVIADTTNSGKYFDTSMKNYRKQANYQVCEPLSRLCSDVIQVQMNN